MPQSIEDRRAYQREYYKRRKARNGEYYKETRQRYYENNKEAYAERSSKWYSDEFNKLKVRERKFGIDFWELVRQQENCCGICGIQFINYSQVHIDHDHETGVVRGLLCKQHNRGLGFFSDDADLLEKAAAWIRQGKERTNGET